MIDTEFGIGIEGIGLVGTAVDTVIVAGEIAFVVGEAVVVEPCVVVVAFGKIFERVGVAGLVMVVAFVGEVVAVEADFVVVALCEVGTAGWPITFHDLQRILAKV